MPIAEKLSPEKAASLKKIHNSKYMDYGVFFLFAALYILITVFHEPWFDEAQAWQIARDASYKDILFYLPHYEGHPPLWHLILSIPAKLGVPYEIGLKSVGFLISMAYTGLILFRSPFPKILKRLLPFNYFLFYQFGVIVRPYGLLALELILLAMCFPARHTKPWKFTAVLMLLCLTHSYGLLIAAGVAIGLLWERLEEKGLRGFFQGFLKSRQIQSLAALLLLAILIILEIFPREDTLATNTAASNTLAQRLICMLFTMIPDCLLFKSDWFSVDRVLLKNADIAWYPLMIGCLVGVFVWLVIWAVSSKKSFRYFVLPYCLFAGFGAIVYMTAHHIGVSLELLIFWLWITLTEGNTFENLRRLGDKVNDELQSSKTIKNCLIFVACLGLLMPIYWSASASVHDIGGDYSYGRAMSTFIKEHNLDSLNIFMAWNSTELSVEEDGSTSYEFSLYTYSTLLPYFEGPLFSNTDQTYRLHKVADAQESAALAETWKALDIPDVIVGSADVSQIFGEECISMADYTVVLVGENHYYYKDDSSTSDILLFVRNDLLEQYNLTSADTRGVLLPYYEVSEETKEAFQNGEITLTEIVDDMLGDFGKTTDK